MSSYYKCKKCNYKCNQRTGMIRHLDKKNKCIKNIVSYKYSDEELYNMSLVLIKNDNEYDLDLFCCHCNKYFSTKGNLKKHCIKYLLNKSEDKNTNIENIDILNDEKLNNKTMTNNTINNITVNQQVNYNFYNVKYPNSFDNEWDLSKISNENKIFLISCCNTKYSELLKYILQNDNNLNVIIDNDSNTGVVYKNDSEKFINMDKSDIIDKSLFKLNQQLNNLCHEIMIKNEVSNITEKIENENININQKYNDYTNNNNNIKNNVQTIISSIFSEKKDESINKMNSIICAENKNNLIQNIGF